jgi:peptide/nickel transport system ATP-binding protein
MYRGDLVDLVDVTALSGGILHPYTRSLLEAVPVPATAAA